MPDRILIVGENPTTLKGYKDLLDGDFAVETVSGSKQALAAIQMFGPFALVFAEMRLSGLNGVEFLARAREMAPDIVGILLTGPRDHRRAVRAVEKHLLFHYLVMPCKKSEFAVAIRLGLAQHRINVEASDLIRETVQHRIATVIDPHPAALLPEEQEDRA